MTTVEEKRARRNEYMREWKRCNREKVNEINRSVKAKDPERYKAINRISAAKMRKEDPERFTLQRLEYRRQNPQEYLWKHARNRAKFKGLDFDLEPSDIQIPEVCPVLGFPLEWGYGSMASANWFSPSLDRFDSDKGYVKGNVDVISNRANHLKNNATLEEVRMLLAYMERRSGAS